MSQHFQDIQKAFCAHIRNPNKFPAPADIEQRRLNIYSELLYNNVEGFVARAFPVIKQLLGTQHWHALIRNFFEQHRSQSPYFMEIAEEFLDYLHNEHTHSASAQNDPPFLLELAHYEWSELALEISQEIFPRTGFNTQADLLKGQIVFSPLAWVLHYQWPVHRISPDYIPAEKHPVFLILYRNRQDTIGLLETSAIGARLLTLIQAYPQLTGEQIVEALAQELQALGQTIELTQLQQHASQTLMQWREQDIILGTRLALLSP